MEVLSQKEAKNYEGGFKLTVAWSVVAGGIISFVLGVVNGFTNTKNYCK